MTIDIIALVDKCREIQGRKIGILFTTPDSRKAFLESLKDDCKMEKDLSVNIRKCTLRFSNGSVIMALSPAMLDRNKGIWFDEMHFVGNFPSDYIDYVRDVFVYDNSGAEHITQFLGEFTISG